MDEDLLNLVFSFPKAELHVHLEGSISIKTLNRLARKKGLPGFEESPYRFSTFKEFDALFPKLGPYFDTPDDFYDIALAFGQRLIDECIAYCEVLVMPFVHVRRGIPFEGLMEALDSAFGELAGRQGVEIKIICSIPRTMGAKAGHKTLDWIESRPLHRIVGIDLAGEEREGTIKPFASVYERARSMGLGTVAHAGEFLGPEAIWETIEVLKPDRIGHGITAARDGNLLSLLAQKSIPLDISLTSNVMLAAVSELALHPVRLFYENDVPFTINTDDPAFFHTTLIEEYRILAEQFEFQEDEIREIIKRGFEFRLGSSYGNAQN